MINDNTIRYIHRQKIDTTKWDRCIRASTNGAIYGLSEYLDQICKDWDGLVLGDYSAVMPLPWKRKWFVRYLYYPPFCAFLGIFGNHPDETLVLAFLKAIPSKFRYWDFPLNPGNPITLTGYRLQQRKTYMLSLQTPYTKIAEGYRATHLRNIRKAASLELQVDKGFPVEEVIQLASEFTAPELVSKETYHRFKALYKQFVQQGQGITYGIRNKDGILLASAVFLFFQQQAYYLLVGNHPNGKTVGASHALIDAFIKDHAGNPLLLDFEGSDIRNLAFFYSSFGAREVQYAVVRENRLPFWIKWLKP